jgi:tetratricopeptide (TPR) repeat protein
VTQGIRKRQDLWIGILLLIAVLAVYSPVRHFDFVNYDDPDYVTDNSHVREGLTASGIVWAFTSSYAANWIPLVWISHMADVSLFGLDAGQHHLTSAILHAFSTLLLFAALRRMTGARWRSAFVAFLFALHPLHVQSVAWVAERKDTLSAAFWMLALWTYALSRVDLPVCPSSGEVFISKRADREVYPTKTLVMAAYCAALLAKPMAVTFPFLLVLLDLWPLRRFSSIKQSLRDKVPMLALSAVVSVVTFLVQRGGGAVISVESVPLGLRIANAFVSYLAYLAQTVWPAKLAVFYPYPAEIAAWQAIGAAVVVAAVSVLVWRARRYPYLATGWFWYLGTLLPVIGFLQVGEQARADRYTYLPLIGIAILIAWGAADLTRAWPRAAVAGLAAAAVIACAIVTRGELQHWRNTETLMTHALDVTTGNYVAHDNLGESLRRQRRTSEAIVHFREAVRIRPTSVEGHNNLGDALIAQGSVEEGAAELRQALRLNPGFPESHVNLGTALNKQGRSAEAIAEYRKAVELRPDSAVALTGLGAALVSAGQADAGIGYLREAIRLRPEFADAHYGLGIALAGLQRISEAAAEFAEAARIDPGDAEAHYNLGTAMGAQGRIPEAIEQFRIALQLRPAYANAELNLGKALAYLAQYDEAIQHIEAALRLNPGLPDAREALDALRAEKR